MVGGGKVKMELIRRQRNSYFFLSLASICLTVWIATTSLPKAALASGAMSLAFILFLVRQSRLLNDATLIWDNRIHAVSSAHISIADNQVEKSTGQIVISTFGMLIGSKIYRWGLDGVHGTRLNAVEIDKEHMYLTFGDADQTMKMELLHGMTQRHAVLETAQKLWHETGVTAGISGW